MAISEARVALERIHLQTALCWNNSFLVTHAAMPAEAFQCIQPLIRLSTEQRNGLTKSRHREIHNENICPCDTITWL